MLFLVPRSFNKKIEKLTKADGDAEPFDALIEKIDNLPVPEEGKELAERLKTAVKKLLESAKVLTERAEKIGSETVVVRGEHRGDFYEVKLQDEIRKP